MNNKRLFVFAGEPSGDLHGSHLINALKTLHPAWSFEGVCGQKMRLQPINQILPMEDFEVMGLTDTICAFPRLYRHFHFIRKHLLKTKPDGIILIDYPWFNLRLAKALRGSGYIGKIIQYVSPTVWAHGNERIDVMQKYLDLLLTIYPFEAQYFVDTRLKVEYVGNPLCEYLKTYSYDEDWKKNLGIPADKKIIALFPGSRQSEISRHLPSMIEASIALNNMDPNTVFGISKIREDTRYPKGEEGLFFFIPKTYTYELMRDSVAAIAKSGTVTLELAMHECPTSVIYTLSVLNRLYAKYILKLKLPYYCIVNILAGQEAFPELIEKEISASCLIDNLKSIYREGEIREKSFIECRRLKKLLGGTNASALAAEAITRSICD